jgi:hypothetical protein
LTAAAAGYSDKPLAEKLGIRAGMTVVAIAAPQGYRKLLGTLPPRARVESRASAGRGPCDFLHCFATARRTLAARFAALERALAPAGMLWISWPKGSSGVATDLTENVVREIGLATGLVDVKVCAVDATWSGLKFVRRVKER